MPPRDRSGLDARLCTLTRRYAYYAKLMRSRIKPTPHLGQPASIQVPTSRLALATSPDSPTAHRLTAIGDPDILDRHKLALFCSTKCPGRLVLQTYDLAQALRDAGQAVVGGFHSPMEQECLALLLRGNQPVIVCPARAIDDLRIPTDWRPAIAAGRLLVLSPFEARERRVTAGLAERRNRFVAGLADEVFVAYAAPGSRTAAFAGEVAGWGKPLLTLDDPDNAGLLALGAAAISPEVVRRRAPTVEAGPLFASEPPPAGRGGAG